jgi:hypothetical protein
MSKAPPGIARFDSAAAMAQALAAALHGERFASPSQSPVFDRLMPAINALPKRLREWAYIVGGMSEGIAAKRAQRLDIEHIAEWIAGLYPQRSYGCAFVGSSNGALTHVAAAMGAPWLPQTFLCPVRAPFSDPDDAQRGFDEGQPIADAMLAADSRIAVHQMQDPNQDRLMLHSMRYFRIKHRKLPLAFREFLLRSVPRGGTLYVVECSRAWPVTRTSERSIFQFGATGGATEDEYLHGGARVEEYLARYRIPRTKWQPPLVDELAPEAEWGYDTALTAELTALAQAMNWRVVEIGFEEPEAMSFAAAEIYRKWYRDAGIEATRLIVDSFMLMDPLTTMRLHALPFWLLFCVEPSAAALQRFLEASPPFDEIDLMLFSHGVESIGLAPIERWRALLNHARREGRFAGVDTARYPRDFATFVRYGQALGRLGPLYEPPPPLSPARFEALMREHGPRFGVRCGACALPHAVL